jgi:cysteine synthase A
VDVRDGFTDTVGNTPLIKLRKASELTGCNVLGKAEFLNPGGSVKDRAAKYMILDAEERGDLQPGGLVVEGTAGNTGIGLALVGNARGYRTVILMPETQSQEKKDMLLLCGVELRCVPAVPYKNDDHYVKQAERLAAELAKSEPRGVLYANQINVAGAIRLAKELGPGHTVVTVLCDGGTRYQSKLFNPEFLRSKDLPVPSWLE